MKMLIESNVVRELRDAESTMPDQGIQSSNTIAQLVEFFVGRTALSSPSRMSCRNRNCALTVCAARRSPLRVN
jgi:hypothetical protein